MLSNVPTILPTPHCTCNYDMSGGFCLSIEAFFPPFQAPLDDLPFKPVTPFQGCLPSSHNKKYPQTTGG